LSALAAVTELVEVVEAIAETAVAYAVTELAEVVEAIAENAVAELAEVVEATEL
jgi:hypothetical protein